MSADTIPVHAVLPGIGVAAAATLAAFSVAMVCVATADTEDGNMRFVSEGMDMHCGWSAAIMATAGSAVALCEIIPAVHVRRPGAAWAVAVQVVTWNGVLGVSDTGWVAHYALLVIFLGAALWYHTAMSRDATYGHPAYAWAHGNLVLSVVGFGMAYAGAQGAAGVNAPRDIAVCCELWLVGAMASCILCLMHSLNRFACIHVRFDAVCC